jgi:hypothetical protein
VLEGRPRQGIDVADAEVQAVEAVGDILFGHVDTSVPGVGVYDHPEEALEAAAELHGLGRGQAKCLVVDFQVGVVGDRAGTSCVLGDDANGGNVVQKHHPLSACNHACHFFVEEV